MRSHAKNTVNNRGFTLVELMIVITVIAIIAGIAVPNYIHSRATANEAAVVGTLKAICTTQMEFKSMASVDADNNGCFEYATLGEITSQADLRGTPGERLSPPLLSLSLGNVDASGRVMKNGYYFAIHLPDAAGNGMAETVGGIANIDPVMAESYWTCVAWPASKRQSGRATFFVNQQGQILKTNTADYSGTTNVAPPGAALTGLPPNRIDGNQIAVGTVGADGNQWVPIQ